MEAEHSLFIYFAYYSSGAALQALDKRSGNACSTLAKLVDLRLAISSDAITGYSYLHQAAFSAFKPEPGLRLSAHGRVI